MITATGVLTGIGLVVGWTVLVMVKDGIKQTFHDLMN